MFILIIVGCLWFYVHFTHCRFCLLWSVLLVMISCLISSLFIVWHFCRYLWTLKNIRLHYNPFAPLHFENYSFHSRQICANGLWRVFRLLFMLYIAYCILQIVYLCIVDFFMLFIATCKCCLFYDVYAIYCLLCCLLWIVITIYCRLFMLLIVVFLIVGRLRYSLVVGFYVALCKMFVLFIAASLV